MKFLLEQIKSPDIRRKTMDIQSLLGYSALHWAARYGHHDIVKYLIDEGCDTELTTSRNRTAREISQMLAETPQPPQLAEKHKQVLEEFKSCAERQESELRPDVFEGDRLKLDYRCFTLWGIDSLFQQWGVLNEDSGQPKPYAEGSFGKIFKVQKVSPGIARLGRLFETVAVKVPIDEAAGKEVKGEVETLSELRHANVVQMLGYFYGPGPDGMKAWMMCSEFCATDLHKMIYNKDKRLPKLHDDYTPQLKVKLIREIIAGLCYCHEHDTCHLDLKPANCLLAKENDDSGLWTAKLADFGADVSGDTTQQASKDQKGPEPEPEPEPERGAAKSYQWLGTYLWMSPEATGLNAEQDYPKGRVCQKKASKDTSTDGGSIFGASDWFSFGIMLWEMWTEKLPHEGLGLVTDDEGHLTQQVWVRDSDGKEDHDVIRGNEPAGGGQWTEDLRAVAKSYYHGNRPKISDDCPVLLSKLMVACWQDKQQDRPSSSFMQKLADGTIDWLHVDAAAPEVSFDEWLADVGVEAMKDELYEYDVREGKAPLETLVELMTEEEEDFAEMLDDLFAGNEDTKERFRAAVAELKGWVEGQGGAADGSASTAHQPGAREALQAAAFR